jgi:hypothetical protein
MIGLEVEGAAAARLRHGDANLRNRWNSSRSRLPTDCGLGLQQIREGDASGQRKATGTLIADNLVGQAPAALSTGTGLAPFASLIKTPISTTGLTASCWCTAAGSIRARLRRGWWRSCDDDCSDHC